MSDTADRFRDERFVSAWSRWHRARHAWNRACDRYCPLGTDLCNPDPASLTGHVAHLASVAQEFIDARSAYKAECSRWTMDGVPDRST